MGKRILISGGSSGIGLAAARQLVVAGNDVAILARTPATLEAARSELAALAPQRTVVAVAADVTDEASVESGVAEAVAALGGVDVLIANQGYARCAPVWEAPLASYQAILDTNYLGHVRLVKAVVPHLRAQRSGAICLVSSMLGFMSFHGYGAYSASKFAIAGFAEALRQELLPDGIEVGVFYPPTTDTPGLAQENEDKPAVTWAIEGSSTQYTPEVVAATLVRGVERGRFLNMVGAEAWFIYYASRWAPWLVRAILDMELRKHMRNSAHA